MSSKWVSLFNKLHKLTNQGKLNWDEVANSDSFIATIGDASIEIANPQGQDFFVYVRGIDGKIVDSFSDVDISRQSGVDGEAAFINLFSIIRRQISGADQLLDTILKELDEKDEDRIPF